MRVFIHVDNLYDGGAGRVASVLANSFCENNEVHVIVKDGLVKYEINSAVKKHVLNDATFFWPFRVIKRLLHYRKLIDEFKPDVIYSLGYVSKYTTFAYAMSSQKNVKIIASERSDPNSVPSNLFMKMVRNWCYGKADILVCQTNLAADYFRGKIKTPLAVIPNPVTPNLPQWNGAESLDFVAACRLDEQKNLPMLLNAFERLHKDYPMYRLKVYGQGHLIDYLTKMTETLGLRDCVSFPGATKEIHRVFASSFAYVSSSNHEGMSNSMLEALAIGVPSVCTDCPIGGAAMVMKNKINGLLTPVGDVDAFYCAMKYLVDNKQDLGQMSQNAMKIRDDVDCLKIASRCMNLVK